MRNLIKSWLNQIASVETISDTSEYAQELYNESSLYAEPYNNNIGEIGIEDIMTIEIYPEKVNIALNEVNEELLVNGCGSFTLHNGDYFTGEFFGNLSNREGKFVQLSKQGLTIEGSWKNGKAEVVTTSLYIFALYCYLVREYGYRNGL